MTDFTTIPLNFNLPGSFSEFNATKAQKGLGGLPHKILLLGHKEASGGAAENTPVLVNNGAQAGLFGRKSMLSAMFYAVFAVNPYQEIYGLALAEPSGTADKWQLDFTGSNVTNTANVNLYLYGKRVQISIEGAPEAIAGKVKTALDAQDDLPIDNVTVSDKMVTFTFIHKGSSFSHETPRFNEMAGETTPEGFAVDVTLAQSGTGTVNTAGVGAALSDAWWSEIVNPFGRDMTLANALTSVLKTRDGATIQKPGLQFSARKDTYSALVTLAEARDSRFETVLGLRDSVTPEYIIAAIYAARIAGESTTDPARGLQYITLDGILPASAEKVFTDAERNTLIGKGISTATQTPSGSFRLERAVTTYKTNSAGAKDNSFKDLEVFYILNLLRYEMNNRLGARYPRTKIGTDDDSLRAGVVRPKDVKAEILALAQEWLNRGLINSIDGFRDNLTVERDDNDSGRLTVNIGPELIGQLRQIFISVQFLR